MEFEKSRIERLKRSLYSRDESKVPAEKRTPVSPDTLEVARDWGAPQSFDIPYTDTMASVKKNNSFFNKFLGVAVIFFFLSLGVALFIFFGGLNMISSNNVDIKIVGPTSISSGEEFDAGLSVINQNRTDLQNVTLYIDYPEGAHAVATSSVPLTHDKIDLGTIPKGGTKDYDLRALFFGQSNTVKTVSLKLEYTVAGSDAVFSKQKTYDISINSSPVILNVAYPADINSGQKVTLSIDLTSNSSVVLPHMLVAINYPYGFTYSDSNIKPLHGNSIWDIGDLKGGDKKTLIVSGTLVGQDMEERSFTLSAGTDMDTSQNIQTVLATSQATVAIRKSFFDLGVGTGNQDSVADIGQQVPVNITWHNTLPDKIVNGHIEAAISGNIFDRSSVNVANGGFYRSVDNTVLWDKNSTDNLTEMSPGDSGNVSFTLASLSDSLAVRGIKNPHIDIAVTMTGDRLSSSDSSPVSSTENTTIKLKSNLSLSSKSYRSIGPLTNTGSVPPSADHQSTYTITWTLTNTTNTLNDVIVSATLPQKVTWTGQTSPTSEKVVYDPNTRLVTWNAGTVSAGTGFTDTMIRRGRYPDFKGPLPFTPGYEIVGLVEKMGAGVDASLGGEMVADLCVVGGYAQLRRSTITRVPSFLRCAD